LGGRIGNDFAEEAILANKMLALPLEDGDDVVARVSEKGNYNDVVRTGKLVMLIV
jgi:translation initiation factor IF-1